MSRIGLYTGSFDPVTLGHLDIMRRALRLVDQLIVAVGRNASKATMMSPDARHALIERVAVEDLKTDRIKAALFNSLTVDFAKERNVDVIIRGLRNSSDMDFEAGMAGMNHAMNGDIETVFLFAHPEHSAISATLVRQIHQMGGDITPFVPKSVLEFMKKRMDRG